MVMVGGEITTSAWVDIEVKTLDFGTKIVYFSHYGESKILL
jgi:S-adenosylmethionine synthetase